MQVLGHKADLMFICFRRSFDGLARAQLALAQTELHEALEATSSYVSVVELGMYEMTGKIHEQLAARFTPGSDEFEKAALRRLGGSIAFARKKGFVWKENGREAGSEPES